MKNKTLLFTILFIPSSILAQDIVRTYTIVNNTNKSVWVTNEMVTENTAPNSTFQQRKRDDANQPIDFPAFRGIRVPAKKTMKLKEPIPNLYIFIQKNGNQYELKYQITMANDSPASMTIKIQDIISKKVLDDMSGKIMLKTFANGQEVSEEGILVGSFLY